MRITLQHRLRIRQPHFLEHLDRPRPRSSSAPLTMQQRHFHQLPSDRHHRIEARHRVLIDHRQMSAAQPAQRPGVKARRIASIDLNTPLGDRHPLWQIAHQRQRNGRFPATGLPDKSVSLARTDRERYVIDDPLAPLPPLVHDRQPIDGDDIIHRDQPRACRLRGS